MKTNLFATFLHRCHQDQALRRRVLILWALAGFIILLLPNILWEHSAQRELAALNKNNSEFSVLAGEYQTLKESLSAIERKKTLTKATSIAQVVGDISMSLGMADKVKSIKPMGTKKTQNQMSEENAEIKIEKLTINEMIQLIYKIENAPMILTMKTVVIKKSFTNPELLDLSMTVSLFTPVTTS